MCMPPPGAGKQSNGNDEEQKPAGHFGAFEQQNEQYDSHQHSSSCGQVMTAEVAKKLFDFIEVHIFGGNGAGGSGPVLGQGSMCPNLITTPE
jgi:hypothetical protein